MRLLLERGANATLRTKDGRTAFAIARRYKRTSIMTLLEAHGASE